MILLFHQGSLPPLPLQFHMPEPTQERKKVSFREGPGMGSWLSQKGTNVVMSMMGQVIWWWLQTRTRL